MFEVGVGGSGCQVLAGPQKLHKALFGALFGRALDCCRHFCVTGSFLFECAILLETIAGFRLVIFAFHRLTSFQGA